MERRKIKILSDSNGNISVFGVYDLPCDSYGCKSSVSFSDRSLYRISLRTHGQAIGDILNITA